jgi:hypothetical protein
MREPFGQENPSVGDDGSVASTSKSEALIKSISKRLRPVCSRMPLAEFDAMVRDMAAIELKYADQTTPSHRDRAD